MMRWLLLRLALLFLANSENRLSTPSVNHHARHFGLGLSNAYVTLQPDVSYQWWLAGNFTAVLDVRTESEYVEGHILGAVFAERLAQATSLPSYLPELKCKDCPLAAHCKSGVRSKQVCVTYIAMRVMSVMGVFGASMVSLPVMMLGVCFCVHWGVLHNCVFLAGGTSAGVVRFYRGVRHSGGGSVAVRQRDGAALPD